MSLKSTNRAALTEILLEFSDDAAFSSTSGQAFVTLPTVNQTFAVSDPLFHDWLRDHHFRRTGLPLSSHDLAELLATFRARAHCNPHPRPVAIRATGKDSAIYIDLSNAACESVAITRDGWQITTLLPEVTFQSTRGQLPLERPDPEAPIPSSAFRIPHSVPKTTNDERTTTNEITQWLLSALRPTGPYPILILHGPPGSGKSALARALRNLIDPVTAPLLPLPGRERPIHQLALQQRVLAFDHVTRMSPSAADALCRISSGIGIQTAGGAQIDLARPIIITTPRQGLHDWQPRPDIASRSIAVELPIANLDLPTPAALYTALSCQLADAPATNHEPRTTSHELRAASAHADPLFHALTSLLVTTGQWTGAPAALQNEICASAALTLSNPRSLSHRLRQLTPFLRATGIHVIHRKSHRGTRQITLRGPTNRTTTDERTTTNEVLKPTAPSAEP